MCKGAPRMEDSIEISQKIKKQNYNIPKIPFLGIYPRDVKSLSLD